jgi:hypothetical protein
VKVHIVGLAWRPFLLFSVRPGARGGEWTTENASRSGISVHTALGGYAPGPPRNLISNPVPLTGRLQGLQNRR